MVVLRLAVAIPFFAGAFGRSAQPQDCFADWHGCSSDRTLGVHGSKVDSAVDGDSGVPRHQYRRFYRLQCAGCRHCPAKNGEVIGYMSLVNRLGWQYQRWGFYRLSWLHRIISLISWTRFVGFVLPKSSTRPSDSDREDATAKRFWRLLVVRA